MSKLLNKKGFISKMATSFSFLFAVLLLLSLPGESADIVSPQEETLVPSSFSSPTGGFSYNAWRDSGKPIEEGNDWASGTFIIKTPSGDLYRSRLSSAWREAAASALDITPLVREQLLLQANDTNTDTSATLGGYGNAALLNFVDKTTDGLLGGLLDSGRELNWVKTLDGEFRAQAGDRPWSLGLGGILSLHERQDSAIGLQFYGNSGENSRGYSGLFYRQALGTEHLLGINSFVDYEEDTERNDDGFWRWTLGGEWRTNWADLRANHYLGLTEAKRQSDGAYIYTADGSDIALNLHAPQAGWLSGELKYYQWDGQYGDADEQGIKYGVQVSPIGLSGFNFNIGYDNPLDGKGSWEGGFSWTHDFGESASSSGGGGLRFNAQDNLYQSSRSSETRQRIRKGLPQAKGSAQTALIFTPENLDITLSYPVSNYLILANVNEFASGGQGNISYAVSSLNSDVNVAMAANANGTHLWWHSLPTQAGNFVIPVVATDEAGAKATLLVNVASVRELSVRAVVLDVLNLTLSYPVRNYLLLPDLGSLFTGGQGSINYRVSSPDSPDGGRGGVDLVKNNATDFYLNWSSFPKEGRYRYNIVATDGGFAEGIGTRATVQLDVKVQRITAAPNVLDIALLFPVRNYLLLPNVDSFFTGELGSTSYTVSSSDSDVNVALAANANGTHLWWHSLPTRPGNFVIPVVATDQETGAKATLQLNVKVNTIISEQDVLDITLSYPVSNYLILANVDSFFTRVLENISYTASSPNSDVNVAMATNANGTHLYWHSLPTRPGNFVIPVVATDEIGGKATLQVNVTAERRIEGRSVQSVPLSFNPDSLSITLSLPLIANLVLASVGSYASGGQGSISYALSALNSVGVFLSSENLYWYSLPTQAGNFVIPVVATDEAGAKATLDLGVSLIEPLLIFTPDVLSITLSLPLVTNLVLANVDSLVMNGQGSISYAASSPNSIGVSLVQNSIEGVSTFNLYWTSLPTVVGNFGISIVATDDAGTTTLNIKMVVSAPLSFTPDALSITLSLPLVTNLVLASVDSFAVGGLGSISYTELSQNPAVDITSVEDSNGTHFNLYWTTSSTVAANFAIPVVATDETGAKATLNINVVASVPLSFTPDVLSITLLLPLVTNLVLANVDSLVMNGQGSISYAASSPNSIGVSLVQNSIEGVSTFNLYWTSLPMVAGNFGIFVVATDGAGAKATLQINLYIYKNLAVSKALDTITFPLPVRNYLVLANVDSFFTGGLGRISYAVSGSVYDARGVSPSNDSVGLGANGNGTHLWWNRLPNSGHYTYNIVATDEETGSKATLQLVAKVENAILHAVQATVTVKHSLLNGFILHDLASFFAGGHGAYNANITYHSAVGNVIKSSDGEYHLYVDQLMAPMAPMMISSLGDIVIDITAIDHANESGGVPFDIHNLNAYLTYVFSGRGFPNDKAVTRVIVELE